MVEWDCAVYNFNYQQAEEKDAVYMILSGWGVHMSTMPFHSEIYFKK